MAPLFGRKSAGGDGAVCGTEVFGNLAVYETMKPVMPSPGGGTEAALNRTLTDATPLICKESLMRSRAGRAGKQQLQGAHQAHYLLDMRRPHVCPVATPSFGALEIPRREIVRGHRLNDLRMEAKRSETQQRCLALHRPQNAAGSKQDPTSSSSATPVASRW